jgi:hypothetical protein
LKKKDRAKQKPSGKSRDRRMKKALAGPAKPAARKKPKRRAMIATARSRIRAVAAAVARWERETEKKIERRAGPVLVRWGRRLRTFARRCSTRAKKTGRRGARWAGKRLRPAGVLLFRGLAAIDAWLRRTATKLARAATRASAVVTPERAICGVVVAAAACLVVSQFVAYRGVQIGQPGYEGLSAVATAPAVDVKTAGSAHAYLLIPLAIAAACLSVLALRPRRRRLGRVVFGLGLVSLGVIVLVDLPAGLDAGSQTARFAGATAVLDNGFYAELVASAVLTLGGLMLSLEPRRAGKPARRGRRSKRSVRPRKRATATIPRRA